MKNEICITGLGTVSKFGRSPDRFFDSLISIDSEICGEDPELHAYITDIDEYKKDYIRYFLNLVRDSVYSVLEDWGKSLYGKRGCLIIGTGMGISDIYLNTEKYKRNDIKNLLYSYLEIPAEIYILSSACSSSAQALEYAVRLLDCDERGYDYVIAGGAEAFSQIVYNGFLRLNSIDKSGCRPFDKNRRGIYPADGAAFFMLEKKNESENIYCRIKGICSLNEAYHTTAPYPDGRYIRSVINSALNDAGLAAEDIDAVIAHGTGTKLNDKIEAQALLDVFGRICVTSPKGRIGHTGGASGAFGLLTASMALQRQCIPHIANLEECDVDMLINPVKYNPQNKEINNLLVNCFAFGGCDAALAVGK